MSKLETVQKSILDLTREEQKFLQDWFFELSQDLWDKQIEEDAKAGRLDRLGQQAIKDFEAGLFKPL